MSKIELLERLNKNKDYLNVLEKMCVGSGCERVDELFEIRLAKPIKYTKREIKKLEKELKKY
tara:strand:+ start:82 stop:267 length:186 start_codon:yes stop_codon:yes gene_type:complete